MKYDLEDGPVTFDATLHNSSLCHYSTQHHWACQPGSERGRLGCRLAGSGRAAHPTALAQRPFLFREHRHWHRGRAECHWQCSRPRPPPAPSLGSESHGPPGPAAGATPRRRIGQFRRSFKFPKARAPAAPPRPRASASGPSLPVAGPGHEATSSQASDRWHWHGPRVMSGQVRLPASESLFAWSSWSPS
jgi:hypothetical protein